VSPSMIKTRRFMFAKASKVRCGGRLALPGFALARRQAPFVLRLSSRREGDERRRAETMEAWVSYFRKPRVPLIFPLHDSEEEATGAIFLVNPRLVLPG